MTPTITRPELTQPRTEIEKAILAGFSLNRGALIVGFAFQLYAHDVAIYRGQ